MKRLSETSAAAVLGNDDLLARILLCLPLKSLVPSKFVSKHWLSLITSPYFSGRLNPNPNFFSGMFLERSSNDYLNSDPKVCYVPINNNTDNAKNQDISSTAIAIFNENPDFYILRSCKGLLLCCASMFWNLYVVNPTTKQFRKLVPHEVWGCHPFQYSRAFLAFDPSKSPHYKVILIAYSKFSTNVRESLYEIQIYSSETSTWRLSGDRFVVLCRNTVYSSQGVFWNGSVHWISGSGRDLLQFNIDQEVFKKISMPPVLHGNGNGNDNQGGIWDIKYFGASEDHLNLVISGITGFKIYEMERDCSGWFVKYCVDLHKVIHALPQMILSFGPNKFCLYSILRIVGRENDDEPFLVLHTPGNIISKALKSSHNRYVMLLCNGCGGYHHPLRPLLQCDSDSQVCRP